MPVDYTIRIPIDVTGQQALSSIDAALGRIGTTTKATAGELRALETVLKADAAAGMSLANSLKDITTSAQSFSPAIRQAASDLLRQAAAADTATVAHTRLESVMARIGGRFVGMASGIPGGGFLGGQAAGGLGLGGGAAIGLGVAGIGAFAGFEYVKQIEQITKWAQAQQNLAAETGITVGQMQQLSRVSELTGVNIQAATKATASLSEEMIKGGARAKEISAALSQLGLGNGVAFQNPSEAINTIVGSLGKIPDTAERARVAVQLLGESGRSLAGIADQWNGANGKVKIIDDDTIKRLADAQQSLKELGNAWEVLLAKASKPVTFVIQTLAGGGDFNVPGGGQFSSFGLRPGVAPQTLSGVPAPLTGPYQLPAGAAGISGLLGGDQVADEKAQRLKTFNSFESAYGTPEDRYSAATADIKTKQDKLKQDFVDGKIGQSAASAQYASLEAQKAAAKEAERRANSIREQHERFQQLIRKPVESGADALRMLGQLPKEFPDLTNTGDYKGFQQFLLLGKGGGLAAAQAENRNRLGTEVDRFQREQERGLRGYNLKSQSEDERETERAVSESVGLVNRDITGNRGIESAQAALRNALAGGTSRYGLTSSQDRAASLAQTLASIRGDLAPQRTALQSTAFAARYGASQLPEGSDARLKLEQEARTADLELQTKEIEARTKSVDAINRFNDSIDKATEAMRSQFSSGFESILLGAQRGGYRGQGGRGALDAFRGFGESIESQILKNVGGKIFDSGGGAALGKIGGVLPDWLTQGTIFGKQDEPIKANTDATVLNTNAIAGLTASLRLGSVSGSVTSGGGSTLNYTPTNYSPVSGGGTLFPQTSSTTGALGAVSDAGAIASAAGALAGVSSGSAASDLAAISSTFGKLDSILKGTKYTGDIGAIFSGTLSTGQEIGAIAGTAAEALGAYGGISTIAKGGARNVTAGTAATIGSLAPLAGGIAKDLGAATSITNAIPIVGAAVGAALSLVSSFIPAGQTVRGQQIAKNIFTQTYLAPQAENITESGNGGYSDFDTHGGVRTSSFSPYPIISQSYADVPRRVDVPGRTISPFGGFQNVTGAKTAAPVYNVTIQAMDSKSIIDRGADIASAFHAHISGNYHPVINTLGQQLGTR